MHIDGQRLTSRPSAKGIYIFGGKKVVIKYDTERESYRKEPDKQFFSCQ